MPKTVVPDALDRVRKAGERVRALDAEYQSASRAERELRRRAVVAAADEGHSMRAIGAALDGGPSLVSKILGKPGPDEE